jgi:hypothetical protein
MSAMTVAIGRSDGHHEVVEGGVEPVAAEASAAIS